MAAVSLIEFMVYGLFAYSSLLMLIISTIKEPPTTKPLAISRSIWMIPGIICAFILAGSGINIVTESTDTSNTIKDINSSEVWTETTSQTKAIVLQSEVWITFHMLIGVVLTIYVIQQLLTLLIKHN